MEHLRQVIKTNHNFVTGEHFEQRMLKPVQMARNKITVQLCDAASGKVVEEAITENAISSYFDGFAYNTIANILNVNNVTATPSNLPSPMSLVLTDSDASELSNPYFVLGNIVGSVARNSTTSVGSHPIIGSYNAAESYARIESNNYRHIHLVYDWPTSSGNGTIQNLYWVSTGIETNTADISGACKVCATLKNYENTLADANRGNIYFDRRGNSYAKESNQYYKILNTLEYFSGLRDKVLADTPEAMYSQCEVNNAYYEVTSSSSGSGTSSYTQTMTITKYSTSGAVMDSWTEDLIGPIPNLVSLRTAGNLRVYSSSSDATWMGYCDFDGWIGIRVRYAASSNLLPSRNSAGVLVPNSSSNVAVYTMYNVLTKQWLSLPDPWDIWTTYNNWTDYTVLRKLSNNNLASRSGTLYLVRINQDATDLITAQQVRASTSSSLDRMHSSLPFFVGTHQPGTSGTACVGAIMPIIANTRLANPITKTTLNTMKIQYDFFFKIPIPYVPTEYVWGLYN